MSLVLDHKSLGEWAELLFMQEARRRGLTVAKPFGDTAKYDVLVAIPGAPVHRVQVKCVSVGSPRRGYKVLAATGSQSKRPYARHDLDFLAAYLVPERLWYIIPIEAFSPVVSLWFFPRRHSRGRYEQYRRAWRLLTG